MVVAYSSPFLSARSSASLLWYLLHSAAIPLVVVNTKGVKVAGSTSITLLAYIRDTFLLVFVLAIYLLRAEVFIRICIWFAHPDVKECRFFLPQKPQACMSVPHWGSVGASSQHFWASY